METSAVAQLCISASSLTKFHENEDIREIYIYTIYIYIILCNKI